MVSSVLEVPVSTAAQDKEAWAPELEVLEVLELLFSTGNNESYALDLHNGSTHQTVSYNLENSGLHHNVYTPPSA